jgi:hypothetical protein
MAMIDRFRGWIAGCGLALLVAGAGCDSCSTKPSAEECRAAIENMRKIRGLDRNTAGVEIDKAIRSCRGSSTKETARCLTNARAEKDLQACEGEAGKEFIEQEREAERKRREKAAKSKQDEDEDKDEGSGEDDGGDATQ